MTCAGRMLQGLIPILGWKFLTLMTALIWGKIVRDIMIPAKWVTYGD